MWHLSNYRDAELLINEDDPSSVRSDIENHYQQNFIAFSFYNFHRFHLGLSSSVTNFYLPKKRI